MNQLQKQTTASLWSQLWQEAVRACEQEPALAPLIENTITASRNLPEAAGRLLSLKLAHPHMPAESWAPLFDRFCFDGGAALNETMSRDLDAFLQNDPAAKDVLCPFLFYKGFHALESYRLAHALWNDGRHTLARFVQSRMSEVFNVDIHPAAKIGKGIMMDHATGIVIGETAVVEDNVLFWHGVTLGGRDPAHEGGDRHPKIGQGVSLGVGCTVLGNIRIGKNAVVAGESMVLDDVAEGVTVVGVPARPVNK